MINKMPLNLNTTNTKPQPNKTLPHSKKTISASANPKARASDVVSISNEAMRLLQSGERNLAMTNSADIPQYFDDEPRAVQSEEEFRRQMMQQMWESARENAEVFRQVAEMRAEEMEIMRKVMLIASRIAAGDNVPIQDKKFLMENSPGMYMLANSSRVPKDDPEDYNSVLSDEEESVGYFQSGAESSTSNVNVSSNKGNTGNNVSDGSEATSVSTEVPLS